MNRNLTNEYRKNRIIKLNQRNRPQKLIKTKGGNLVSKNS